MTNSEVSAENGTKPNVVGSLVKPHDRFKNAALFLCGYLKYPEEKVDDVAGFAGYDHRLDEPDVGRPCHPRRWMRTGP